MARDSSIPARLVDWLDRQGFGQVVARQAVGGGCINHGLRLQTATGASFFLKTNSDAPADMFEKEAQGLAALCREGGPRLPAAYLFDHDFLLLEDLSPASPRPDYWVIFGRQLALLHKVISPSFGFEHDNYIGSNPQSNPWTQDGCNFFAEQRLLFQGQLAGRQGYLGAADLRRLERLAARLPELVPAQPASLIHGDLWSGNAISDSNGLPAFIDPAAHYGWAEAELAMTALFGAFPEAFYQAYVEVHPLEKGFRQRYPIYNLYHLLNHLNLFGGGYIGQVQSILYRFG